MVRLELPPDYRRQEILAFHSRDPLATAERVTPGSVSKALLLAGEPTLIEVELHDGFAVCRSDSGQPVEEIARHLLGLSIDPVPFEAAVASDQRLGPLVRAQTGLRLPQAATPFEALTWAVIGQQINLSFAITLRRAMIHLAGMPHASGLVCYPDAAALARLTPEQLTAQKFSRAKAATLLNLARLIADGTLVLELTPELPAQLLAVPGIGPWTVNYALLRGFAHPDCSLHGDVAVRNALQLMHQRDERISPGEAESLLAAYQPYRSLAAAHLWASLPQKPRKASSETIH